MQIRFDTTYHTFSYISYDALSQHHDLSLNSFAGSLQTLLSSHKRNHAIPDLSNVALAYSRRGT